MWQERKYTVTMARWWKFIKNIPATLAIKSYDNENRLRQENRGIPGQ
jgi:hypothetical protein